AVAAVREELPRVRRACGLTPDGRGLWHGRVAILMNPVEGGRCRSREIIRISRADNVWGLSGVRVARCESKHPVHARDRSVVRIEPQVLTSVTNQTNSVNRGVEIKAERLAAQGCSQRRRAHRRRTAVGRIDRIKAVGGGRRVKLSVSRAEIDADDAFTL